MFRQASRNHRSQGLKVKHVLQMCLLLAILVWLLYQVHHSHHKKKLLDENNLEVADNIDDFFLKLGAKDLIRGVQMAPNDEKHSEDEEKEHEDGNNEILKLGRKDLNHGVEMAFKNEKNEKRDKEDESEVGEESVDEERGGGDDEIDEHDQEEVDEEDDHGQSTNEEKEARQKELKKEDKEENEEKGGHSENVVSSENHNHDGDNQNSQGDREEHYKADDASNAVVRDNQMIRSEVKNELRNAEEHVDNIEKNYFEIDHKTNRTEDDTDDKTDSNPNAGKLPVSVADEETTVKNPFVNATTDGEGVEVNLLKLENESLSNMTTTEFFDPVEFQTNATVDSTETSNLYLTNETAILNSAQDQNENWKVGAFDTEKPNSETLGLKQTDKSSATIVAEETQTIAFEKIGKSNATDLVNTNNVMLEQSTEVEKSKQVDLEETGKFNTTNVVEESDDNDVSSLVISENSDAVNSESADSSSSVVTQGENDALTDIRTLPQIESKRKSTEDGAAE